MYIVQEYPLELVVPNENVEIEWYRNLVLKTLNPPRTKWFEEVLGESWK